MVKNMTANGADLLSSYLGGRTAVSQGSAGSFEQFMASRDASASNAPTQKDRNDRNDRRADRKNDKTNNVNVGENGPKTRPRPEGSARPGKEPPGGKEGTGDKPQTPQTPQTESPDNAAQSPDEAAPENTSPDGELVIVPEEDGETVQEIPDEEIQIVMTDLIAAIAEVPPEAVTKAMQELNVKPEDLADPKQANKLLQTLLKAENPADLLTVPEYPEKLKTLTEAAEVILQTSDAEVTEEADGKAKLKSILDRLTGFTAATDDKNRLVIAKEIPAEEVKPLIAEELAALPETETTRNTSRVTPVAKTESQGETKPYAELPVPIAETEEVTPEIPRPANPDSPVTPVQSNANQAAAAAQKTAETVSQTRADPVQVMEQIVSKVKTISAENFAELRITLRPEQLGDVTLRVAVQNGVVMALFVAESQRVKEIIENHFNQLRDALAEQGIDVSELNVSVDSENSEEQMNEFMNQFIKSQQEASRRLHGGGTEGEEAEEPAPVDPSLVMKNTVDFIA